MPAREAEALQSRALAFIHSAVVLIAAGLAFDAVSNAAAPEPSFYKDVLPILKRRCQNCHRPGEAGKMSLMTWSEVRPWASAIREAVKLRTMPPWFADPRHGKFSNDPRLPAAEVATVENWIAAGAPEGARPRLMPSTKWEDDWKLSPDLIIGMPKPFPIPAGATVDYQFVVLPLSFTFDRWVSAVEIRPSDRSAVHHAVLYIRPLSSDWLRDVPPGVAWAPKAGDEAAVQRSRQTAEDILGIYTPGSQAATFPDGMAKLVPAGSDLVLQLHYTSGKEGKTDQTAIGLVMAKQPPKKRILTLQMGRDDLRIPPGEPDYKATVTGSLPNDALLISLFPHMHLRGSGFDFEAFRPGGEVEMLLKVKPYDFNWQLTYTLETPRLLRQGTVLKWTGHFDNSRNNPRNPDPSAEVTWGEQSWEEMMIGFFDVAVEPGVDKSKYFAR